MTSPTTMSAAQLAFYNAVAGATATVSSSPPPGVVQGEINYDALLTGLADFGFASADAINVFAQDFQAAILEALNAGILAASIAGAAAGAHP